MIIFSRNLQIFCLIATLVVLSACSQPSPASVPNESKEVPLITDADIDRATLQLAGETTELLGLDEAGLDETGSAEGSKLPALADVESALSTQAVLPNTSGFVYYLKYNQNPPVKGVAPYSLYRHNQQTDVQTIIYSGSRQIQSVAGSRDGTVAVVSMRETTSSSSDFEIYLLLVSNTASPTVLQLTNDGVDNINVSMSNDIRRIVYQESVAGLTSVILRKINGFISYDRTILSNTQPQRQPSISGDGRHIALVRDLANGNDAVLSYDIALNRYTTVVISSTLLDYPSLSDNGLNVLWLENGTTDQVILKNLTTATLQTVATATAIGHPSITADGKFMTYQSGINIVTKDLKTGQVLTIATPGFAFLIGFYAPSWQKLFDSKIVGSVALGSFGISVAVDGNLMIVGAISEGAAYIYQRNSLGSWSLVKRLVASDGAASSLFGHKVAISADTVVVGAQIKDTRGAAYIFQKDQGGADNWGEVKKLVAIDGATDDHFGISVAISGSKVAIGAYFEDHDANGVAGDELNVGAAYIFQRNQGGTNNWGQLKKLIASDNAAGDTFGCGVALSGTTLIVGACNESHDTNGTLGDEARAGAAYIFEQNQGGTNNFEQVKKLVANDGGVSDQFGISVSISATTLVVGAHSEDHDSNGVAGDEVNVGAAYIFQKDQGGTNTWGQVKKLIASDDATFDFFGHAVAISGHAVVVGAYDEAHDTNEDGSDEARVGAAYVFQKDQGGTNNWGQLRKLTASDGAKDDSFSEGAVAISGGLIVVGAWSDDNASGVNAGAVYFYE